jgi:hypothetical protein
MSSRKVEIEASQILDKFEGLPAIASSAGWEQSLMNRLVQEQQPKRFKHHISSLSVLVTLLLVINAGLVLNTLRHDDVPTINHAEDYHTISRELLINPIP